MINRFQRFLTRKKIKLSPYIIYIPNYDLALCYDYSKFPEYYCHLNNVSSMRAEFRDTPAIAIGDFRPLNFRECATQLSNALFGTRQCLYTERYKHIDEDEQTRVKKRFDKRMFEYVNRN